MTFFPKLHYLVALFLVTIWLFVSTEAAAHYIDVEPTWSDCSNDTSLHRSTTRTLLDNITSDIVLQLKPGCHFVDSFVPIRDMTNVTIKGVGDSPSDVVISCGRHSVGLLFLGVSGLRVQNLTVSNCNLTGEYLNETLDIIENNYNTEFQSIFYYDINRLHIAMFIVQSSDVTISNVNVQDNAGYGLVAVNVLSSFVIESCDFNYNYDVLRADCFSSSLYGLGGGALVLYQDNNETKNSTDVSITNTKFMYNANCQLDNQAYTFSSNARLYDRIDPFTVGGGGGLSMYLANQLYPVKVNIIDCYFKNNTALSGGGMLLGIFVDTSNITVTIADSVFYKNGLILSFDLQQRTVGEGLFIIKDIPFPNTDKAIFSPGELSIMVKNCHIQENLATAIAGVAVFSGYLISGFYFKPSQIHFDNCTFIGNQAYATSALYLQEAKQNGFQPGILFYLTDTTFIENVVLTTHFMLSSKSIGTLNTVVGSGVSIIMNGVNTFKSNVLGTPITLENSLLEVEGDLNFTENTGNAGGGLALITSLIIVKRNSYILFRHNVAYLQAGAIYSSPTDPLFEYDCYLFFEELSVSCNENSFGTSLCPDPRTLNISIKFDNNTAPISNVAFGSTLNDCPWRQVLLNNSDNITDSYRLLEEAGIFHFKPPLNEDSLSTPPVRLTTNVTDTDPVMLGQQVDVTVISYDGFDQPVPDPISSVVYDNTVEGEQDSRLGNGSYWFVSRNRFNDVPVSIRSRHPVIQTDQLDIGIYSIVSTAGNRFNISVTNCFDGFEFIEGTLPDGTTPYKTCECNEVFDPLNIRCFKENATIIVPNEYWLGKVNSDSWAYRRCLFDYCKPGDKLVVKGRFKDQCNTGYHRTGVLCGECEPGYSQQFGSNKCTDGCSTMVTVVIVVYYAIIGLSIIYTIGRIGFTVSYGYINSLFFFANIVYQFQSTILPSDNFLFNFVLFYPIDILNGGIGYKSCIYRGMTALQRSYVRFVIPIYLYTLLGLFVIAVRRCSSKIGRFWTGNPAQVLATIILMTYVSLLQSSIDGLSFTYISIEDHDTGILRWSADPNVKYFGAEHAPLAVLCLAVLLLYLIPSTIMLLFPSLAFRTPIGKKLIPIYDAFWAPFKDRLRFWIGLRLILRVIPLVLSGYVPRPYNLFFLELFVVCYTFTHIIVRPFIREVQNILDIYLNFCLLLLISGSSFTAQFKELDLNGESKGYITFYSVLMVFLVYFAVYFVAAHHLYMRIKCLQEGFACLKYFFRRVGISVKDHIPGHHQSHHNENTTRNELYDEIDGNIQMDPDDEGLLKELYKKRTNTNVELREPLLDDEYIKSPL